MSVALPVVGGVVLLFRIVNPFFQVAMLLGASIGFYVIIFAGFMVLLARRMPSTEQCVAYLDYCYDGGGLFILSDEVREKGWSIDSGEIPLPKVSTSRRIFMLPIISSLVFLCLVVFLPAKIFGTTADDTDNESLVGVLKGEEERLLDYVRRGLIETNVVTDLSGLLESEITAENEYDEILNAIDFLRDMIDGEIVDSYNDAVKTKNNLETASALMNFLKEEIEMKALSEDCLGRISELLNELVKDGILPTSEGDGDGGEAVDLSKLSPSQLEEIIKALEEMKNCNQKKMDNLCNECGQCVRISFDPNGKKVELTKQLSKCENSTLKELGEVLKDARGGGDEGDGGGSAEITWNNSAVEENFDFVNNELETKHYCDSDSFEVVGIGFSQPKTAVPSTVKIVKSGKISGEIGTTRANNLLPKHREMVKKYFEKD